MRFCDLGLTDPLLKALQEVGYQTPSPIQEKSIPPVLQRRDLLGCAQTGTGKTAAFALPLLQLLQQKPAPKGGRPVRLLVLTPTRELAAQIQECFENYGKYLGHRSVVIFGGVGQQPQIDALHKGADILVATPGRLLDLCGQGHISLKELEFFVLDEADRMLDMGFIHDIRRVIKLLPAKRQTLFFSATMPEEIRKLAAGLLTDPVEVAVDPVSSTVEIIEQKVLFTDKNKKRDLLLYLLEDKAVTSALVFSRTKHLADRLAKFLKKNGVAADSIHGDKSQGARLRALGDFKSGKCRVLVATDIAARGIDVSGISHVFNFDLPDLPETYVHRIGRTGRAGQEGVAISFCTAEEAEALWAIEKLIGKRVTVVENHPCPASQPIPEPPKPQPKAQPKSKKKHDKNKKNLQKALKKVEETKQKQEKRQQTQKEYPSIDLDAFRDEAPAQLPMPSGGFSSDVRLPGWVAARSGGSAKKEKAAPTPKAEQPEQERKAEPSAQSGKKGKGKKPARKSQTQQPQPAKEKVKKEVFLQPQEDDRKVGTSSRSRKRREPVWIPVNDQPIVTRPQSYFIEPPKETEPEAEKTPKKKKKRRRKPTQKSKTTGGTQ
ncbi:MAG: DEAD/DEAH box helicase [Oscillospiraceae bacterium]|nr:DEAD/DEAH box helicase [Oscillospiraceae bacterium]